MNPLDLKFTPDWLKEEAARPRYRDFEGEESDRVQRGDRGRKDRGERKPGGASRRPDRGNEPRREERARRQDRGERLERGERRPRAEQESTPAAVHIEFLPDRGCVAAIVKQIQSSGRAYPLVEVARMFIEQPERYRVRIKAAAPNLVLYRCGEDGPVSTDRAALERQAFDILKQKFYTEEVTQKEAPRGNYTNVARCRLSGTLIAPTNHHSYQPALHRLYEERFSRRMSFADYQRAIEVVHEPAVIEEWKNQARSVTTYKTVQEPVETFASEAEAREHFARTHRAGLISSGNSFEISGDQSRRLPDSGLSSAVRAALQRERQFPAQLIHHLRGAFLGARLHIFKPKDRRQFVSAIRPQAVKAVPSELAAGVAAILRVVADTPECTRKHLVDGLLGEGADIEQRKSALASDLHWLITAGHVIEFHDGTLAPVREKPPVEFRAPAASAATPSPKNERAANRPMEPAVPDQRSAEEHPASEAGEGKIRAGRGR